MNTHKRLNISFFFIVNLIKSGFNLYNFDFFLIDYSAVSAEKASSIEPDSSFSFVAERNCIVID